MDCSRLHRSSCNSNHRLQPLAHPKSPQERNARSNSHHCDWTTAAISFSAYSGCLEPNPFSDRSELALQS
jgi:hypothetical protein